ncbi:hypothetical protein [Achromobacter sp.]|uniref:hypothetical protein n=1 Tax=Achromobacter sp. TaxID=134375 RepID=UPI0028A8AB0A|nr:hypothetical protein [Achromobacter sp.]
MKHVAHVESFDRRYHHAPIRVNSRLGAPHVAILLPKLEVLDEAWDLARRLRGGRAQSDSAEPAAGFTRRLGKPLPLGEHLAEEVMSLPMHPYLDQDVTQQIIQAVTQDIERNAQR